MDKKIIITKIILTLILVLGMQYLGIFGYSMTDSIGCLAGPLWIFSYVFDITMLICWVFPIMIHESISIRNLILLAIFNIFIIIGVFYGVAFLFPDIFLL